jgi:hypothetical protein
MDDRTANEPRVIGFEAYLSDDDTEVTGLQVHPDADSMGYHMQVAFEKIMEFDQYLDTQGVEVYYSSLPGPPFGDHLSGRVDRKGRPSLLASLGTRNPRGFGGGTFSVRHPENVTLRNRGR